MLDLFVRGEKGEKGKDELAIKRKAERKKN